LNRVRLNNCHKGRRNAYLSCADLVFTRRVLRWDDGACTALQNGLHELRPRLQLDLDPLGGVHVEHDHVLCNHSVLSLATENNHRALIHHSRVILARANRHTFSLADFDAASFQVILEDLVCALAYLPLAIELEATAENVQFVVVGDCGVALAALDLLLTLEVYFLPDHLVAHDLGAHDLFNRLLVHSADHVR
jgi:hypothetical protein